MTTQTEEKLIESMQAPPAYPGARPEFEGPMPPDLVKLPDEPPVVKNDRVEELSPLGKPTGEIGTVLAADESQAVVKWDDDGRELVRQRYLELFYGSAEKGYMHDP
jgi:hypothetical protein